MVRYFGLTFIGLYLLAPSSLVASSIAVDLVTHLDKNNYQQTIENTEKPIVIDIFATWCEPCTAMKPIFERFAQEHEGKFVYAKIDFDESQDIAKNLGVKGLPTFVVMQNGKILDKIVGGYDFETFKKKVNEALLYGGKELQDLPKEVVQDKFSFALRSKAFEDTRALIAAGADVNIPITFMEGMPGIAPIVLVTLGARGALSEDESMKMFQLLIDNGAVTNKVQLPGESQVKSLTDVLHEQISSAEKLLETSKRMLACLETPTTECTGDFCPIKTTKASSSEAAPSVDTTKE